MGYTYADLSKEIDAVVEDIWHRIDLFLEMVFAVNKELKFKDLFGVKATTLELLHGIIGDTDTKTSILHSLQELTKNEEGGEEMEETLTFHEIMAIIIRISKQDIQNPQQFTGINHSESFTADQGGKSGVPYFKLVSTPRCLS